MSGQNLPWWAAATRPVAEVGVRFADVWDALFGRIETFYKVELDGSWFICEPQEVWAFLGVQPDGDFYTITEVRMTRRQFNNLPEFEGF